MRNPAQILVFIPTQGQFFTAFRKGRRQGGNGKKRGGGIGGRESIERHQGERETLIGSLFVHALIKGRTHNLGMYSDQKSDPQPFNLRDQPTEPHCPGPDVFN